MKNLAEQYGDLDSGQQAAVLCESPSVCVLAGAGSGKTRVLTRRVARRISDGTAMASHTLVLTFTRKAAGELKQRLKELGVEDEITTGTFHAVAFAQLRQRWLDQGRPAPAIAASPLRLIENVLHTMRRGRSMNAQALAAEISWAKSRGISPEDYEQKAHDLQHHSAFPASQIASVYGAYESEKRKRRTIDFEDLLLLMIDAIKQDRSFADSQRWMFRHIYVDEFQDVNKSQFDLLQILVGGRDDVFVVGDPNQAIYGWNGADASYLSEIEKHFPGIEILRLETNYRSTQHVLAAAGAVLPKADAQGPSEADNLFAVETGMPPQVCCCADERDEALVVARQLHIRHDHGWRWADMAVLVRTNAQRLLFEEAFKTVQVPFRSEGGTSWLRRHEVKEALDGLREFPRHRLARYVPDIEETANELKEVERSYLDDLVSAARECLTVDPNVSVADFLYWLEVVSKYDAPSGKAADQGVVTVTTFHRAKGLEWPVVFLAGVEEGLVPHGNSSGNQLAEEQRLFYVAVTRARSELYCTWAKTRKNKQGNPVEKKPSRWLVAIEEAATNEPLDAVSIDAARESMENSRVALFEESDLQLNHQMIIEAAAIRERLDGWRVQRAKLNRVEPKLILSDAIIQAIIDLRPTSTNELTEIEGIGPVRAASIGEELLALIPSNQS